MCINKPTQNTGKYYTNYPTQDKAANNTKKLNTNPNFRCNFTGSTCCDSFSFSSGDNSNKSLKQQKSQWGKNLIKNLKSRTKALFAQQNSITQNIPDEGLIGGSSFARLEGEQAEQLNIMLEDDEICSLIADGKIYSNNLALFASLKRPQFEQLCVLLRNISAHNLLSKDAVYCFNLIEFNKLEDFQIRNLNHLLQNSIMRKILSDPSFGDYILTEMAKLEETPFLQLTTLLENDKIQELCAEEKIDAFDLRDFALLRNFQSKQLTTLLENDKIQKLIAEGKLNSHDLVNYARLDESQFKQLNSLFNNEIILALVGTDVIRAHNLNDYAHLNEAQNEKIITLLRSNYIYSLMLKRNINAFNLNDFAKLNETQFKQLNSLLENEYMQTLITDNKISGCNLCDFAKLDETQFKRLNILLQNNNMKTLLANDKVDGYHLKYFAQLNEAAFEYLTSLLQKSSVNQLDQKNIEDLLQIHTILNSNINYNSMKLEQKARLYKQLREIKNLFEIPNLFNQDEINKINTLTNIIADSLGYTIAPTQITKTNMKNMMSEFFANNRPELDNLLSGTDFAQFGKNGLPLVYSRKTFLDDLSKIFKEVDTDKQTEIAEKLGITILKDSNGNIKGYNGIINLTKLEENGIEGQVLTLAKKFIKENSVVTDSIELDKALNSLINGMPEFINIVGKQQHATQELSVDVHILTVLKNALANQNYKTLSDLDKTCLKFAIVLHDIAKSEGVVDKSQPQVSALYARNILEKYTFPKEINDRIYELVKNHHWLEDYNSASASPNCIASYFRHKDDYTIAKIMADSDLKGIGNNFYNAYSGALEEEKQKPIIKSLEAINSTGQLIFTSKIIRDDLIPRVKYKGHTYKVIDFTKMNKNTDMSHYGFAPDVTYDSARFYIHMTENTMDLEIAKCLSDVANDGFLCASYVSLDNCNTFADIKYGVSLEAENVNIANAKDSNQGSGMKKDFKLFSQIISGEHKKLSKYRLQVPNSIKKELNLSDEEYSRLYQLLATKKYLSQIQDRATYVIGTKSLSGSRIKKAIKVAESKLFSEGNYNELNLYNPNVTAFVAKVNSIDEVPDEFLEFARRHNLPIYLLGNSKLACTN